jgi:hypothetical protein
MLVHFFEVRNCTFESYKGEPVLFAPCDIDDDTLMKRGFRRSKEERWYRPVNMKEYSYIVYWAQYGDVDINDAASQNINNFSDNPCSDLSIANGFLVSELSVLSWMPNTMHTDISVSRSSEYVVPTALTNVKPTGGIKSCP